MGSYGEDKNGVSVAAEGERGTSLDVISENLHETEAPENDLIHAHTFEKSNVRLRVFGNLVLLV